MKVKLLADKVLVRGPRIDGTWIISLEVGEYEKRKVAELIYVDGLVEVTIKDVKN